ncbi:trypsin-like peptidase domain-containing protein [Candidatus Obscuribacterales bacterium]|nr:trypsin-like peptidase domain-containing protein [Candidatus Obscuribacterales bacterium]
MAKEIDDDVPIYFSPDEDLSDDDLAGHQLDRKALMEDEPPAAWERYSPAKTLEQAAKEAETRGEKKIKGIKNRSSFPPSGSTTDKEDVLKSVEAASVDAQAGRAEQSMTLDRFLKLSGRFLKPNLISTPEDNQDESSSKSGAPMRVETPQARKRLRVLVVVACINVFAIGFWCGSFLFPNKILTSMRFDEKEKTASSGPRLRGDSSVANVAAALAPCVVNIDTRISRGHPAVIQPLQSSQQFFQPPPASVPGPPRGYSGQAQGTGLIVTTSGHIITSNHVVPQGTEIRVTLSDGREFSGSVVGRDAYSDLAVIKIGANNLPVPKWADSRKVRVGDWAVVIGSPHGYDHSVTVGVVSSLGRIVSDFNHHIPMLQTDAAVSPGNSGGPVANIDGEVIGIAAAASNMGVVGINFALPADTVASVAKKIIEQGGVARPFLGIYMEDVDPDRKKAHTLAGHPVMVLVKGLVPNGPADKVGITRGDILVRVNGKAVRSSDEVRAILGTLKPGDAMEFSIRRLQGPELTKKVILEKYPDNY